jgi:hypothetical protein
MGQEIGTNPGRESSFESNKAKMHEEARNRGIKGISPHFGSETGFKRQIPHRFPLKYRKSTI